MSNLGTRRLAPADIDEILRLVTLEDLVPALLARELTATDDYLWVGLVGPHGELRGVHRGMRWGCHLLLKGVFIDDSSRGSGAALQAAFALRDMARSVGYAGIMAWVEPHKREARLARLLRLRQAGPLLHRFEVPLLDGCDGDGAFGDGTGSRAHSGAITLDVGRRARPMVDDLLRAAIAAPHDAGPEPTSRQAHTSGRVTAHWVADRRRLVLSAFPCHSITDLSNLVAAVKPLAKAQGAWAMEIPVPAADLPAALSLAGMKARRLSRTPVRIGRLDFPTTPPSERPLMAGSAGDVMRGRRCVDDMRRDAG